MDTCPIKIINGINECVNFFQTARSIYHKWKGTKKPQEDGVVQQSHSKFKDEDVLQLQRDLQYLSDSLPAMYNLIDRAEWKIHESGVDDLLSKLKDAVYDAEDLLDEFRWYEQKVTIEDNTQLSSIIDFLNRVIEGSSNSVSDTRRRLTHLSGQLENRGLHHSPRFDKLVRPETTSSLTEENVYGREEELKKIIQELLLVPANSKRRKTNNQPPVLSIVGIGGIGKTTLAQNICNHPQVECHFDQIIWICVSDDFDVKRLTKEAIQASGGETKADNLDTLQRILAGIMKPKRFLIVLDDMWDDALKENGQCWKRFCTPFKNALQGSKILVTTRSQKVAHLVCPMESFPLGGLRDDIFWDFFKHYVFGFDVSDIEPELESMCKAILPKLRGSPLAAKTLGRLLAESQTEHWNNILTNELWELKQEATEILPALRLSYMYLPFHLKRCFSFCATYPKDHQIDKDQVSEIWVAEGFVVPQGNIPLLDIGSQYFQDLVNRSFFQQVRGKYVIHDLIHDMAQLVSKDECFIAKDGCDYEEIPQNVRHLYIRVNSNLHDHNILKGLGKHTKLRTILCEKSLKGRIYNDSVLGQWFYELRRLRVISLHNIRGLPENISYLKHLRYIKISGDCPFRSLPSSVCSLYNLQILDARKCNFESLPKDFSKLINLRKFEGQHPVQGHTIEVDAVWWGKNFWLINNINKITEVLVLCNLGAISKDHAADMKLWKMEHLNNLTLRWSSMRSEKDNESEVLQVLRPPTSLKSIHFEGYPGEYLPSWYQPHYLPEQPQSEVARLVYDNNGCTGGVFQDLTELSIEGCKNLSSLEQFLKPVNVPSVEKILIENCEKLQFLHGQIFEDFHYLRVLEIGNCPHLKWRSGMVLPSSLERLVLQRCGDLSACFPTCLENLTSLQFLELSSCENVVSVPANLWSNVLVELEELRICYCLDLESIGGSNAIANINKVHITGCDKLMEVEQPLRRGGL